jgi:hypothetical protein
MFSRYKHIDISNIKSIEFIDDCFEDEITKLESYDIESITYDKKLKIYIVTNSDGLIFNPKKVKITYESILK